MITKPNGRETITSLVAATGLTAAKITNSTIYALVQAIGGDVRFTLDGSTAPVAATTGHRLVQDSSIELWGHDEMKNFSAIDDGGTAQLEVTYNGAGG
jgi:hypothetical protein